MSGRTHESVLKELRGGGRAIPEDAVAALLSKTALFMITVRIMISDYDYLFLNVITVTIT